MEVRNYNINRHKEGSRFWFKIFVFISCHILSIPSCILYMIIILLS